MNNIAIITARGGSKRIPRKNIRDFLGQPIIAYSIQSALDSKLFNEVMVSTDDEEIAEIARSYGAKTPYMRSDKNSDDHSSTADVLKEVLTCYKEDNLEFDYFCCLYPTAPFVSAETLENSFNKLKAEKALSLIPVTSFSYPIQRALKIENEKLEICQPENTFVRSQDLESRFHDVGQFYWMKCKSFLEEPNIFSKHTSAYIINELEVQDIDNETDWKLAELKYQLLHNSSKA